MKRLYVGMPSPSPSGEPHSVQQYDTRDAHVVSIEHDQHTATVVCTAGRIVVHGAWVVLDDLPQEKAQKRGRR